MIVRVRKTDDPEVTRVGQAINEKVLTIEEIIEKNFPSFSRRRNSRYLLRIYCQDEPYAVKRLRKEGMKSVSFD